MSVPQHIVVIGAGLAGAKTAESLRKHGHTGPITLAGEESHLPYERPPLSKEYLSGGPFEDALVRPEQWYTEHDIDLRRGVRATAIDRATHTVALEDGSTLPYDEVLVRGDLASREFLAFWRDRDGVILAVMAVNTWDVIDVLKPLLIEHRIVDAARLTDPSVELTTL